MESKKKNRGKAQESQRETKENHRETKGEAKENQRTAEWKPNKTMGSQRKSKGKPKESLRETKGKAIEKPSGNQRKTKGKTKENQRETMYLFLIFYRVCVRSFICIVFAHEFCLIFCSYVKFVSRSYFGSTIFIVQVFASGSGESHPSFHNEEDHVSESEGSLFTKILVKAFQLSALQKSIYVKLK